MLKAYRVLMLQSVHELPLAGHLGVTKTNVKITRHFYWLRVKKDVKTIL